MTTRQDTLISGPIQSETDFYLGGFGIASNGQDIDLTKGYSLYCYQPTVVKGTSVYPVALFEGWYDLTGTSYSDYQKVKFNWMSFWDVNTTQKILVPYGIRYPIVFYTKIGGNTYYLVSGSSDSGNNSNYPILSLRLISDVVKDNMIFDLNDYIYDWMDGTVQLQSANLLIAGRNSGATYSSVHFYPSSSTGNDGLPVGVDNSGKIILEMLNIIPITTVWQTKTGAFPSNVDPLIVQQCYRMQQLGKQATVCPKSTVLGGYVGVTEYSNSIQSKYMPYFVSNNGCGGNMKSLSGLGTSSKIYANDLIGKQLPNTISGFGESSGYCARNTVTNVFETDMTNGGGNGGTCPKIDICTSAANDSGCRSVLCAKCTPTNCPDAFKDFVPKDTSLTDSRTWVWVVLGVIIFLVLGLIGFAFYNRSYKDSVPDDFWDNPQVSYQNMTSAKAPPTYM